MIKVWYLYFIVVSNVTETPLHVERQSMYFDSPSCLTAMSTAQKHIGGSSKIELIGRRWGKNVRREFDCLSFLVDRDDDAFMRGHRPGKEHEA